MDYIDSRNDTTADFDNNYPLELKEIERDINKTMHLYLLLLSKNPKYFHQDKFEYLALILRSVDYLISAMYLVRQRAATEAGSIIRLCLETSSVAIHIHSDKNEFKKYKQNHKYESVRAISYAKKHIEGLGELWNGLSQVMIHPNTYHGIRSELIGDYVVETAEIHIGFKPKNEFQDKLMLLLLRTTANIILRCFEIIVSEEAKFKGTEGLYIRDCEMFMFGNSTEKLIYKLMDEFKNKSSQQADYQ